MRNSFLDTLALILCCVIIALGIQGIIQLHKNSYSVVAFLAENDVLSGNFYAKLAISLSIFMWSAPKVINMVILALSHVARKMMEMEQENTS